jgi:hypothetical protein
MSIQVLKFSANLRDSCDVGYATGRDYSGSLPLLVRWPGQDALHCSCRNCHTYKFTSSEHSELVEWEVVPATSSGSVLKRAIARTQHV